MSKKIFSNKSYPYLHCTKEMRELLDDQRDRIRRQQQKTDQEAQQLTPLSWEIEFPEVFDRGNPGFDAIVGNPPFAGKNTIIRGTSGLIATMSAVLVNHLRLLGYDVLTSYDAGNANQEIPDDHVLATATAEGRGVILKRNQPGVSQPLLFLQECDRP